MDVNSNIIFSLDTEGEFVILNSDKLYENVSVIKNYIEDVTINEGTIYREFRWSSDSFDYSNWIELTEENLQQITSANFFVDFKYTLQTAGNVVIRSVVLDVEYDNCTDKNWVPNNIAYPKEKGSRHYPLRVRPFTFNPYKQNQSIKLHKDLSYMMNNLHGHDVVYFRSAPQQRNRDVLLGEYTISFVEDPICVKVLVPNNDFPDNKVNYGMFGVDFELPFEVHLDKRYFESIFGHNKHPQKMDIIYFPLNNRIYEITSSSLVRDFMQEPVYWKASLIKYQPKASRIESTDIKDIIGDMTTGIEELFGKEIEGQMEKITIKQHSKDKSSKFDPIREYLDPNLLVEEYNLENAYTTISQYYYNLSTLYKEKKEYTTGIRYKITSSLLENEDRMYTCWFKEIYERPLEKDVLLIDRNETNELTIYFRYGIPNLKESQWLEIYDKKTAGFSLFGEITYVNYDPSALKVKMLVPPYHLELMDTNYPDWQAFTSLMGRNYFRRNFIDGYNKETEKGILIDTFNGKWIRVVINDKFYWYPLNIELNSEEYYGLIVSFSNKFKQLCIYIYRINNNKDTSLNCIYKNIINNITNEEYETGVKYEIKSSNLYLTNIRLMKNLLEEEKHSLWLNQNIIKDSDLGLIIDNAIPKLRLPYIGNVK